MSARNADNPIVSAVNELLATPPVLSKGFEAGYTAGVLALARAWEKHVHPVIDVEPEDFE